MTTDQNNGGWKQAFKKVLRHPYFLPYGVLFFAAICISILSVLGICGWLPTPTSQERKLEERIKALEERERGR
jgi:hypothetical protein